MSYKVLHGVNLTTDLLNTMEGEGWYLVDYENRMGLYDIIFSDDSGGGGGGGSSIKDAEKIDDTLKIVDKTLGVKFDNSGNIMLSKSQSGISSNLYWTDFQKNKNIQKKNN